MPAASKAILRSTISIANGAGPAVAPSGEYDICRTCDGAVSFCNCATAREFTLSIDAVMQHLCEGRITLIGGRTLPALAK